jgi:protein phosphatase
MLTNKDIHAALGSLRSNLPLAAQQLVQLANDSGGSDNISVILVRVLD